LSQEETSKRATIQHESIALLKVDIYKTFDTIFWQFIGNVLKAKGFPEDWVHLIERAILQGSSRIILNSIAGKKIQLRRGVRQDNPISSYLFIIAIDFLNEWINKLESTGMSRLSFIGCKPYLLYADDTLLLLKPDQQ
jgi:Reverse transcriptase (RNA-dependent DNA polymerase)